MNDASAAAASAAAVSASTAPWPSGATAVSSSPASGLRRFVLNLPPGYHFLPTDAELVVHYLRPRLANQRLPLPIFFDEHILHYHPGRLVEKYREYGEDRWFFFVRRERKHEGGNRPNRATLGSGHWNATGSPRLIRAGGALVGRVRTLVFYEEPRTKKKQKTREEAGEASKGGAKTEWTMYEYESLTPEEEFVAPCADCNARMDAIVLCTIQKKKQKKQQHGEDAGEVGEAKKRTVNRKAKGKGQEAGGRKRRKPAAEPPEEDHAQRGTEALVREHAFTGVADFSFPNTPPPAPPPPETMMMAAAAGGDKDNYMSVHPSTAAAMTSWQFQFPAVPLAHERVPHLDPKILAPLGGGNYRSIMAPSITWMDLQFASATEPPPTLDEELSAASWIHAPLTRRNEANIAPSVHSYGFGPGISSSSYGFAGGNTHRPSTGTGHHHHLSRLPFPSQPSYGVVRGTNAQGSAASMVGSEEWRRPFSTQGSSGLRTNLEEILQIKRFLDPSRSSN